MRYGIDSVYISSLHGGEAKHDGPLLITPRTSPSISFLVEWCKVNRSWLDEMLIQHGAIFVRGFDIETASDMETVVQAYEPNLDDTYHGISPRKVVDGTRYFYSAADVPTYFPIPQHIEMSYLPAAARKVFFGCLTPSRSSGGETSLADFSQVYQELPTKLAQKLAEKGILYTRVHEKVGSHSPYDVNNNAAWSKLFGTTDKNQVEQICAKNDIPVYWDDDDALVSTTYSEAFQLHPITGKPVWFNHIQVFHWTSFPVELLLAWWRTLEWRLWIHFMCMACYCLIKYVIFGRRLALDVTYGDGEPLPFWELHHIRRAIHKHVVYSRWEKGDILWIDNWNMSHGRQPTFDSGREIVVAWSDVVKKTNLVTSVPQHSV